MKNIKYLTLTLMVLAFSLGLMASEKLNMHITQSRFRDTEGNTIMHIDYQVPYRSLFFEAHQGGYFAELIVTVSLAHADSLIPLRELADNVGITNKLDATSDKYHLNRLSFLLDKEPGTLVFNARDVNSGRSFNWELDASPLLPEDLLSDIQLCSVVKADSSAYLSKFHRKGTLYKTEPSLIFDKVSYENMYLYLEAYLPPQSLGQSQLLVLYLEKDSLMVQDEYIDFTPHSAAEGITLRIPLDDLSAGTYRGTLTLQTDETFQDREFEFFITELHETIYSLIPDVEDELQVLRYFNTVQMPKDWQRYDQLTKQRYISGIYRRLAAQQGLDAAQFLGEMEERISFANRNFKYFKDGWKTDLGRIYIRNGKPDELEKGSTTDDYRFVSKDYQIWKYRGRVNAVYLFLDVQMNGNYQLIWVYNDDMESTTANYQRYLGEDFDTSKLRN